LSTPLRLDLSPSRTLAAVLVCAHGGAAICAWLVLPGAAGALLAGALFALGLAAAWSRALLASGGSVRSLEIDGQRVVLGLANGETFAAEIGERRFVSSFMVSLPVRRPARRTLLVTADMLGRAEFRRLRVWALWGKLPRVAPAQAPA